MKIILLSDTHLNGLRTICDDNLDAIKSYVADHGADFAIHLGDIAADGATYGEQLIAAAHSFSDFGIPLHFVPGNHDVGDNPIAPGRLNDAVFHRDDAKITSERLAAYRAVFGPDHWSIDLDGWQLIGLNAQLFATGSAEEAEQMNWLEARIATGDGSIAVFLHKPLFRNGHGDSEAHIRYVPAEPRRKLVELLMRRPLKAVFSGHVHQDRSTMVDGVEHNWVPSASFCMPDGMQERIGAKVTGIRVLDLAAGAGYRVTTPEVPGLGLHNVVHHADIDPRMTALRLELGARGEL